MHEPEPTRLVLHFRFRLLALPTNIRLSKKGLQATSNLAHCAHS
jgi:hypothetical protein